MESRFNHPTLEETGDIYTVSEISDAIRQSLESEFPRISVFGEITNFTAHSSGHFYFTLRDEQNRLGVVIFSRHTSEVDFGPENGMMAVACGRISHYGGGGRTQLIATALRRAGDGELELGKRRLLSRLMEEGLTDPSRKRGMPSYPMRIAVMTSPGGAALRDIRKTLARRWPVAEIALIPVQVQGEDASGSIVRAFDLLSAMDDIDVVILARGGGNAEDLWAFNNEAVARAVAGCEFPVVTGIGHEIDTTVCDYVADLSAATPTAAAEMVSPDSSEVRTAVLNILCRITSLCTIGARHRLERVAFMMRSSAFPAIEHSLDMWNMELDERIGRLAEWGSSATDARSAHAGECTSEIRSIMIENVRGAAGYLSGAAERLARSAPEWALQARSEMLERMVMTTRVRMQGIMAVSRSELEASARALKGLGPVEILERGYAYCTSEDGKSIIGSVDDVQENEKISVNFFDGHAACLVEGKRKESRWRRKLPLKAQ